jgi:hypothetical protein
MNPYAATASHPDVIDRRPLDIADLLAIVEAKAETRFIGYTFNPRAYDRLIQNTMPEEFAWDGGAFGFFGGIMCREVALQKDEAIEWHDKDEMRLYVSAMESPWMKA